MKTVNQMWVFDVDGVITNPQEKRTTEPEILNYIVQKLELSEPVAINTGRPPSWIINRVVNPLLEKLEDERILQNFFISGELGGKWITFDKNGKMKHHKDDSISVPKSLQKKVKAIIYREFSESMVYDNAHEAIIGIEIRDRYPMENYREQQKILVRKLEDLLEREGLNKDLKVSPSNIGTDINNKNAGKGFAMERVLNWLKTKGINPKKIICFGDSKSDFEMAQKAKEQGFQTEFVYVGGDDAFENVKTDVPIIITKNKYEKGTLEFLKNLEV